MIYTMCTNETCDKRNNCLRWRSIPTIYTDKQGIKHDTQSYTRFHIERGKCTAFLHIMPISDEVGPEH